MFCASSVRRLLAGFFPPLALAVGSAAGLAADSAGPAPAVVTAPNPDGLERYAADQLCQYLDQLYGLKTRPQTSIPPAAEIALLVGSPETNHAVAQSLGPDGWPAVSDQGLVIKRGRLGGKQTLVIGGGSPRATLWAVYELVERWGVRYLLHGDVLPERPGVFQLPQADVVLEPNLTVRQWRVVNEHAMGPVSWGIDDYRPVLDQLAKLKFNRLFAYIWPLQPFVHFQAGGVARTSATIFFGLRFPITDDLPGRRLFGGQSAFWNPDLPLKASYEDLMAAGQRHLHALFDHARRRGMQCVTVANLGEFPPEFAPLVKNAQKTIGVGDATVVPGASTEVDDPALTELAAAILRATVDTYPEVDFIDLGMQEHRQWADQYQEAWEALDRRYGIESVRPLAALLETAGKREEYPGGAARAVQEVKGDIVALRFYDRLLHDLHVLKESRRPDMRFVFDGVAEELFPVLPRIAPRGSETLNFVDYTPARILRRRHVLANIPSREIKSTLIYTLHDDNVGVLPQLATGSLAQLTGDLRKYGWAGFSTRYWLIGDHEPCVAYLAKAAWDEAATPAAVYRDQVRRVCGPQSVDDMLTVFREVEETTVTLEWHGLGLTFPVPGMITSQWTAQPLRAELLAAREGYERALAAARQALDKAIEPGRGYIGYWIGRLEFGLGYFDTLIAIRLAAAAEKEKRPADAVRHAETALATIRRAIEAYARVARDQSDRGTIATLGELVYRPLKEKAARLKEGAAKE